MSVIITYVDDNAQTPLGRFVVYMLYKQVCNKYDDISNRWSLVLSLSVASIAVGAIISSPLSATLFIAVHGVQWRIFSKSTVKHTTSISANADKPRDAASRKIDHIARPTKYNYQATSVGR